MVLTYKGMLFPLLIATGSFILCLKMRIPVRLIFLRLSQPVFIAAVVLILKFFFTGEEPLFIFDLYGVKMVGYKDGLFEGLRITSRIIGGISLVIMLSFATPFTEFVAALAWLRIPRQFIEIMMFAYRYLFVFLEDATTIYNAQKNRLGYAGIRKGLHSFGILTGSLVLRGFEQSQKTSEAMVQRGYSGDMPLLKGKPLKRRELLAGAIVVIIGGVIWMI
jgi:cobalt/nickel transport system permease protein